MRSNHTIDLDDLQDHVSLKEDATPDAWPGASIELDVRWHPAEPDVGIMGPQSEIVQAHFLLGSTSYASEKRFVEDLYLAIGDQIEETQNELGSMISSRIENEELDAPE